MSGDPDEWICRIPRAHYRVLASSPGLRRRERVLIAMLAQLYERYDKSKGQTAVSLRTLEDFTGLHRRTVRIALQELVRAEVVLELEAPAGKTKWYSLGGCAEGAHPARNTRTPSEGTESAHPQGPKARTPKVRKRAPLYARNTRTPVEEEKNSLKNFFEEPPQGTENGSRDPENGNGASGVPQVDEEWHVMVEGSSRWAVTDDGRRTPAPPEEYEETILRVYREQGYSLEGSSWAKYETYAILETERRDQQQRDQLAQAATG